MKKEEKRIRTLSLQQLYEELGYLEDDLKSAKHRQHEKHIEQLVEGDVSDKRILKDILWITGGFATFHTMYIFLARPIQNPVWLNYLCQSVQCHPQPWQSFLPIVLPLLPAYLSALLFHWLTHSSYPQFQPFHPLILS